MSGAQKIKTNSRLYGYKYINAENRLEIIPDEAATVRLIFELYANGKGARQIANELNETGRRTRAGGEFGFTSIRRILDNEKYAGLNNALKYRDPAREFSASDSIPAIIDKELFDKCQSMKRQSRDSEARRGVYKGQSKYHGLVYCGACGKPYHSNTDNGRRFYNCSSKRTKGAGACDNPNVSEAALDRLTSGSAEHISRITVFNDGGKPRLEITPLDK